VRHKVWLALICVALTVTYLAVTTSSVLSRHEPPAPSQVSSKQVSAEVRAALDSHLMGYLVKDIALRHWRLFAQEVKCTGVEATDTYYSATYEVHRVHALNCSSAAEWPVVKGRMAYMKDHGSSLTDVQRALLQREVDMWIEDITSYIRDPQDCYDFLKVVGLTGPGGTIDPATLRVYGQGPEGDYIALPLSQIPSSQEVERVAYASMDELLASAAVGKMNDIGIMSLYNRLAARDYANRWTSNPTTYKCNGSNPGCIQDDTKYNNAVYEHHCCNDCANFVSQALRSGGIPEDTVWKPASDTWEIVPYLVGYMTTMDVLRTGTLGTCVAGYPVQTSSTHIVLMVYNDGVTEKYSAHTSDRLQANWYHPPGATYYTVTTN